MSREEGVPVMSSEHGDQKQTEIRVPGDIEFDVSLDRTTLASLATHDLRESVQAVNSFLAVVLDRRTGPLTAVQEDFLSSARYATRRAGRLIDDVQLLLSEGTVPAVHKQPVELAMRISACCRELSQVAREEGVTLHCAHQTESHQLVFADPDRVDQVILNLLENAIQYAPAGSVVRVGTPESTEDQWGVFIENTVDDARSLTPRAWLQPFGRGGRVGGRGLGLGLTVVQQLLQAHQGQLRITTDADRVRVSVFLPKYVEA